mmetsp:Transcript_2965/g.9096  ORF Transcript_2965/g.9096 Transcript_2965/m.9096 type:complete len:210 (-) Transcript_2965:255-884(-)
MRLGAPSPPGPEAAARLRSPAWTASAAGPQPPSLLTVHPRRRNGPSHRCWKQLAQPRRQCRRPGWHCCQHQGCPPRSTAQSCRPRWSWCCHQSRCYHCRRLWLWLWCRRRRRRRCSQCRSLWPQCWWSRCSTHCFAPRLRCPRPQPPPRRCLQRRRCYPPQHRWHRWHRWHRPRPPPPHHPHCSRLQHSQRRLLRPQCRPPVVRCCLQY